MKLFVVNSFLLVLLMATLTKSVESGSARKSSKDTSRLDQRTWDCTAAGGSCTNQCGVSGPGKCSNSNKCCPGACIKDPDGNTFKCNPSCVLLLSDDCLGDPGSCCKECEATGANACTPADCGGTECTGQSGKICKCNLDKTPKQCECTCDTTTCNTHCNPNNDGHTGSCGTGGCVCTPPTTTPPTTPCTSVCNTDMKFNINTCKNPVVNPCAGGA